MGIECPPNIKDVAHNLEFKVARGEKNDALGRRQPPRGRESYLVPESGTRTRIWRESGTGPSKRAGRRRTRAPRARGGARGERGDVRKLGGYAALWRALSEKSASTRHTAMQP